MARDAIVSRLRSLQPSVFPVLSVYVDLHEGIGEVSDLTARLKDLLKPIKAAAAVMPHAAAESLRADIAATLALRDRIASSAGSSIALFCSTGAGMKEFAQFSARVRDAAVAGPDAWVRPLAGAGENGVTALAAVVDAARATLYDVTPSGVGVSTVDQDPFRKPDFGGWYGLEEYTTRNRAREAELRHYRAAARALHDALERGAIARLFVGGHRATIDAVVRALDPWTRARVAGTFVVDPATTTTAQVRAHCERLSSAADERRVAASLASLASSPPDKRAVGLGPVLDAANAHAISILVVASPDPIPGVVCTGCGWLARHAEACPVCGSTVRAATDVLDLLVRAVEGAGGTWLSLPDRSDADGHIVAALERFHVPSLAGRR